MKENFNSEVLHLNNTIMQFDNILNHTKKRADLLPNILKENPFQLADLLYRANLKIKLMKNNLEKPYFARIDFERENGKIDKCYIGKIGVSDIENKIITVDWRAPIASLYYDSNVGNAKYNSLSGIEEGHLNLKRQYIIEKGKLNSYEDIDTVANDEMLRPYLKASADNRLKNIVSTIQYEQNDIIRESINKNIIVQGVAGSGKTTVALHRVAYLVYNNIDRIKSDEYLVIGPNNYFIDYISNILPDLDTPDAKQLTYFDLVKDIIGEKIMLNSEEENLNIYIKNYNRDNFSYFRQSMNCKNLLDEYIEKFKEGIKPNNDLEYKGYKILSLEEIKKIYYEENSEILKNKIDKIKNKTQKYIEANNIKLLLRVRNEYYLKDNSEEERLKLKEVEKEIKNRCTTILKKYFSKSNAKIINMYIQFIQSEIVEEKYKDAQKDVLKNLKNKKVDIEDLPAILYIYYKIYGIKNFDKYKHTVIDEAQDYGEFSFYALKRILIKSTFSIFGDLAQSIYSYKSINSWKYIKEKIFNNSIEKKLIKSYRTTKEIMTEANKITKYLNLEQAEPVIRTGEKVNYIHTDSKEYEIKNTLEKYISLNMKTIAIICKDKIESEKLHKKLNDSGYNVKLISREDKEYQGGICILTSSQSKGLEFDAVIISEISDKYYNIDNEIDMKLLYVTFTRALHNLTVICTSDKSNILEVLR